ncbi:hypothetical protein C8R44DRAFT_729134 [Mycena epipterygia]|nr:hypothetical protein C8R44DRAFT_729134 [Mycena epipterygia]
MPIDDPAARIAAECPGIFKFGGCLVCHDGAVLLYCCRDINGDYADVQYARDFAGMQTAHRRPKSAEPNYFNITTDGLRRRADIARRISRAWRTRGIKPKFVHKLPLKRGVTRILCIPSTEVFLYFYEGGVFMQDWRSGKSEPLPLSRENSDAEQLLPVTMWIFWVAVIEILELSLGPSGGTPDVPDPGPLGSWRRFRFFVALSRDHLAVVGSGEAGERYLRSFKITFEPAMKVTEMAVMRMKTVEILDNCSLGILDDANFLLASNHTVAIFTLLFPAGNPRWTHRYLLPDELYQPPIVMVEVDSPNESKSVVICTGNYVRRVFFDVGRERCVDVRVTRGRTLREWQFYNFEAGFGTGVYRISRFLRDLTGQFYTFPLHDEHNPDLYRLTSARGISARRGSIIFALEDGQYIQGRSLFVDEARGMLTFVVRDLYENSEAVLIGI